MIAVHKAQHFSLPQPALPAAHHRRHPSAPPALVVQPTRTPGLIAVSKPQKASPHRQLPSNQRKDGQRPKPNKVVRAPALLNPAEITEKKPANAVLQGPVSPTPVRGRVVPKQGKDRSASRGKHGRQPSPPIQPATPPSQAEVQIPSSNHFNPFLDSSNAIPVPKAQRPHQQKPKQQLARSDPTQSHMRPRKTTPRDKFPICDDMTDAGDGSDLETPPPVTPPATPLRKQAFVDSNMRTAPNMKSTGGFPFNYSSPPAAAHKKGRRHNRAPSEGVFNLSFSSDEDVSAGPGNNALLEYARKRPQQKTPATPSPSLSRATAATAFGAPSAGFFASSMFQNSPSPDELPDPSQFN